MFLKYYYYYYIIYKIKYLITTAAAVLYNVLLMLHECSRNVLEIDFSLANKAFYFQRPIDDQTLNITNTPFIPTYY